MADEATVTVDDRTGSAELLTVLRRRGVPAALGRLEFGDVAFLGNGPGGAPVAVGIEVKKLADVLKCVTDGRFAGHQLPGMLQSYQFPFLLVEGRYRPCMVHGTLQHSGNKGYFHDAHIGNRQFMYKEFDSWLLTMRLCAGVQFLRSYDRTETAFIIADLFHWFVDKEWEQHSSHRALNESAAIDRVTLVKPSLVRRMAAELAGIGWTISAAVARRFATVEDMVMAEESDWREIEGIGKARALECYRALRTPCHPEE